jgi:hypothetical protein
MCLQRSLHGQRKQNVLPRRRSSLSFIVKTRCVPHNAEEEPVAAANHSIAEEAELVVTQRSSTC